MKKEPPVSLSIDDIREHAELITHAEFRAIRPGIGMVISFACMECALFRVGQPYRAKEIRVIRILRGTAKIYVNLVEYEIKERMFLITPPNSLIELLELSEDYDFQIIALEDGFLPAVQGSDLTELYGQYGIRVQLTDEEWEHTGLFFSLLWKNMQSNPFRREEARHLALALLYTIRY